MSGPTIKVFGGENQMTTINTPFTSPIEVLVSNSDGVAIAGSSVVFSITNSGSVTANFPNAQTEAVVTTNSSGQATSPDITAGPDAGSFVIILQCGTSSQPVPMQITLVAKVTKHGGDAQSVLVGQSSFTPVSVNVLDSENNPAPDGSSVTFAIQPADSGYATFTGGVSSVAVSSKSGLATTPDIIAGSLEGSFNIVATLTGASSGPLSVNFSEKVSHVGQIVYSAGNGQTVAVGAMFASLVVQVLDARENPIPDGCSIQFDICQESKGESVNAVFYGELTTASVTTI